MVPNIIWHSLGASKIKLRSKPKSQHGACAAPAYWCSLNHRTTATMNHPNQKLYPVLDSESDRRFFCPDLVSAIIDQDREFFEDPEMQEFIQPGQVPLDWESMDLLEQIMMQIGFVAPPPRPGVTVEAELAADLAWAEEVLAKINAINATEA